MSDAERDDTREPQGRLVLLAGGTSAAGRAAARALLAAGARVIVVGRDRSKLADLAGELPGIHTEKCDLTDQSEVRDLVRDLHDEVGRVDGVLHLVGGWRGGGGLAGQT
jgi:NADP-dependent 3-hydroxy acid dehydrogenase YdfG